MVQIKLQKVIFVWYSYVFFFKLLQQINKTLILCSKQKLAPIDTVISVHPKSETCLNTLKTEKLLLHLFYWLMHHSWGFILPNCQILVGDRLIPVIASSVSINTNEYHLTMLCFWILQSEDNNRVRRNPKMISFWTWQKGPSLKNI